MFKTMLFSRFASLFDKRRNNKAKKQTKTTKLLIAILAIYCIGCGFLVFGMLFYNLCDPLCDAGLSWLYFAVMGIMVLVICFIGSVFMTQSQIFDAKDNELLLSMPVPTHIILITRLLALLILNYLIELLIVIPAAFVYCSSQPVTLLGVLYFGIVVIVMPFLVLAISCLLAWAIAMISSKLPLKNLITLIFSVGFMAAYLAVYSQIQSYITKLIVNGEEIAQAVRKGAFPFYHLGNAIAGQNITSLIIFVLCALIPFGLVYLLLYYKFIKIATSNKGATHRKYKAKKLKVSGVRISLIKKEIKHFISNPMYILNAAIGMISMIVLAGALIVKQDLLTSVFVTTPELQEYLLPLLIVGLSFLAVTNFISAPSISLEGDNLWIIKVLPVSTGDILMSKVYAHIIICMPAVIIAGTVCCVVLSPTLLEVVLIYLLPTVMTVFGAVFGVVMNLQFPKFEWTSETAVIKQGMSSTIAMFGSMAILALPVILYAVLLNGKIVVDEYMLMCGGTFIIICCALFWYLKTKGKRRFEAL